MKKIQYQIIFCIVYSTFIYLTLHWFDWKVLVIVLGFIWANNIEQISKTLKD